MSIGSQFYSPDKLPVPLRTRGYRWAAACLLGQIVLLGIIAGGSSFGDSAAALSGYLSSLMVLLNLGMWLSLFATFFYNWMRGRNEALDQRLVFSQLADLLKMGIPLPEALEALAQHQSANWRSRWSGARGALLALAAESYRGEGLGAAMRRDSYFPAHWSRLLELAEERGMLVEVLEDLQLGRSDRPWFTTWFWIRVFSLWFLALPVGVFLATYILPTFVTLFEGLSLQLPPMTQFVIFFVRWVRSPVGTLLQIVLPLGLIAAIIFSHLNRRFSRAVRDLLCLVPPFRQVIPLQDQASLAILLGGSLRLGLADEQALELAAQGADHPAYRRAFKATQGSIADVLAAHPKLFSAPLRWLARQGERQGNLEEALNAAAVYLTEQADGAKLRCSVWLEWAMTAFFGMVVTLLVVGTYLPIIQATMNLLETSVMP